MSAAAYFDVDGTLVDTNLLHPAVLVLANQPTPLQSVQRVGRALLDAPVLAASELLDRRMFNERLFSHYRGITRDRMRALSQEIFESVTRPRIFKGTLDLIEKCKESGLRVVLVSGSLDYTIEPLARHLGVDDWIANQLEYKSGKATGKLVRPVVAGPDKVGLITRDAQTHGHELSDCHAYSDSYSDVPMLSVVGHPFVINPDRKLMRLARAYDWPILDITRPPRGPGGPRA